mgnify:FL=1
MDKISIIIPTHNVAQLVIPTLQSLGTLDGLDLIREVIFSDGGSDDSTEGIASACGAKFIQGPAGRGEQLQRGVEASTGSWLLILHADTRLSSGWEKHLQNFMQEHKSHAGYFQFALEDTGIRPYVLARLVSLRCRLFSLPYGDQGLFISRDLYEAVGGYAEMPLMEDVDLVRRIGRDNLREIDITATTSAARYQKYGYLFRTIYNLFCMILFFFGVSPSKIKNIYEAI